VSGWFKLLMGWHTTGAKSGIGMRMRWSGLMIFQRNSGYKHTMKAGDGGTWPLILPSASTMY
jgi:hypothetical protein